MGSLRCALPGLAALGSIPVVWGFLSEQLSGIRIQHGSFSFPLLGDTWHCRGVCGFHECVQEGTRFMWERGQCAGLPFSWVRSWHGVAGAPDSSVGAAESPSVMVLSRQCPAVTEPVSCVLSVSIS